MAASQASVNAALAAAYAALVAAGDTKLYYVKTDDLFSPNVLIDGSGTAEGCHNVDAGFHDAAATMTKVLGSIIQ